jgi:hypothetical protein
MEGKLRLLQSFLALKTLSLKISCRGRENLNLNISSSSFAFPDVHVGSNLALFHGGKKSSERL